MKEIPITAEHLELILEEIVRLEAAREYLRGHAEIDKSKNAEIERLTYRLEVAEMDRFEQQQEIGEQDAKIERLREALENMCDRLEQIQYDHNTCDGDLVLEEARAALARKEDV